MKNIVITGSHGMIGSLILGYCLERNDVAKVTSVVRKKSGIVHPKLVEIIHKDFLDYSSIAEHFKNQDIAFYCIGVYTGQVPKEEFRKITVDFTEAFAKTLRANSENTTFCFLSGAGADSTEKSPVMFAHDKGVAENILLKLNFAHTYIFRPAYIYPVTPRKEPNFMYSLMRFLWPVLKLVYPNGGISSEALAKAMVKAGFDGAEKSILENKDIREIAKVRWRYQVFIQLFFVIAFVAFILWITNKDRYELEKNRAFTTGTITNISGSSKGVPNVDYKYEVGGKVYTRSTQLNGLKIPAETFIGKSFYVIYDTLSPANADIIIDNYDYNHYNVICPDSLKWALRWPY